MSRSLYHSAKAITPGGVPAFAKAMAVSTFDRLSLARRDKGLTVVCPPTWKSDDISDYSALEKMIDDGGISDVYLDLSRVEVINPAMIWLIDQIQWKCVTSRLSFHLGETSKIAQLCFNTLRTMHEADVL